MKLFQCKNKTGGTKAKKIFSEAFVKFRYCEKATKFCGLSTVDWSYVVTVKSTMEILQNFVAFSERMNFKSHFDNGVCNEPQFFG